MRNVLVIGGPTASGKSGLALALAETLGGVVINADSMQLYDGLPTLTAQPSEADKARAPHALYAVLPPAHACTAARWRDMALAEVEAALARGRLPIVTGGTGFYLKTLVAGISPMPDIPPQAREKAAALQRKLGNPGFHAALKERDPEMAARLDPHNTQRLVRAWEVLEHTGKSLSFWQAQPPVPPPAHLAFLSVFLLPPRAELYARCDARFDAMLAAGAAAEVRRFAQGLPPGATVPLQNALGYAELAACLDGTMMPEQAAMRAKQATRNYAKRQVTWFRHQMRADILLHAPDPAAVLACF